MFEQHRARFVAYARRRIGDLSSMDAEDVIADVFFTLLEKADLVAQVENLSAYVYRSIANKLADYRGRNKPISPLDYVDDDQDEPLSERLADPSASVERYLERKDVQERLYEAIGKLEPKQRTVWIATEIEGRSFKELSRSWREPLGTLLSRKSRATKALQAMLKDLLAE